MPKTAALKYIGRMDMSNAKPDPPNSNFFKAITEYSVSIHNFEAHSPK
jgi:hypothetical protein